MFLVFERFLAPCLIELLMFYCVNCIECFYVNDEPESKFLYIETIKLYCIVFLTAGNIQKNVNLSDVL